MGGWLETLSCPVAAGEPSWLCQGPGTSTGAPLSRGHLGAEMGDRSMLHTTSGTCAELLPGLSSGYCEVTACPLALRGHALNGIQDPAPCPSCALSCARIPAGY